MDIPPDAGQFLETRLRQINEVARLLNLPPILIGGSLEAGLTYTNQSAAAQRLIDRMPTPVGQPLGPELDRKLLTKAGRATRYSQLPTYRSPRVLSSPKPCGFPSRNSPS